MLDEFRSVITMTSLLLLSSGLSAQQLEDFVFRGRPSPDEPYGYLVRGSAWQFADRSQKIFVCWENASEGNADARRWVQDQITRTWQKHTSIDFEGWEDCAPKNSGIRIIWEDSGPHVAAFGSRINGIRNGMVLNHAFERWSPSCKERAEECVRSIAVHEFGHALGFAHEQNRPDTPGECAAREGQGQLDEVMLTPYDPDSVMNYCNERYNNDGELSAQDIRSAQTVYGSRK